MPRIKENKGVTLIALVVTIVVLLILSGITLSAITGDSGVVENAKSTRDSANDMNEFKAIELAVIDAMTRGNNKLREKDLKEAFANILSQEELDEITGNGPWTIKRGKNRYIINDDGEVERYEYMEPTKIWSKLFSNGTLILSSKEIQSYTEYDSSATDVTVSQDYKDTATKWNSADIKKVVILDKIAPQNAYQMFYCTNLESIENIENLHTENINNMSSMFYKCNKIKELDLSRFDTSNVQTMAAMFVECSSLEKLNINNFNTANVKSMSQMFQSCTSLKSLDLSSFNTSNVTNMNSMFNQCTNLTEIDVSSFNTEKFEDMDWMFRECKSLQSLNLNSFNTSKVKKFFAMFARCTKLQNLQIDNFSLSSAANINDMFASTSNLTNLNLSSFDFSNSPSAIGFLYGYRSDVYVKNTESAQFVRGVNSSVPIYYDDNGTWVKYTS